MPDVRQVGTEQPGQPDEQGTESRGVIGRLVAVTVSTIRAEMATRTRVGRLVTGFGSLMCVTAFVLHAISGPALVKFAGEDKFGEYLGALAYLSAGIILFVLAVRRPTGKLALFGLGFGFFVVGAEEISWGQRIFGWSTPEFLLNGVNVQNETTLHNIDGIHGPIWLIGLTISIGAFIVWPIARGVVPLVGRLGRFFDVPVPSLWPSSILMVQVVVLYIAHLGIGFDYSHWLSETAETMLGLIAFLFAIEAWQADRGAPIPIFRGDD